MGALIELGLITYNGQKRDEEEESEAIDGNATRQREKSFNRKSNGLRVDGDDRFTMIGLDNEIPLGYDDYETMSQLPIATERDEKDVDDELAFALASHGVVREYSSALNSANQRWKTRGDEHPCLSSISRPSTFDPQPSIEQESRRKRSRRRLIANLAIGVTTALLASWFLWCGVAAWHTDSQASGLTPPASNQVVYQTTNIEDLVAGDTVIAMNPETGEVGAKKVLQTFERVADHLQIVTFEYGDGTSQIIETTDEHPFWLRFEKTWTRAADLKPGDTVTGPNDEIQIVTDNYREEYPEGIEVYNFEVEDWHSYFVFANCSRAPPVLVHNSGCKQGDVVTYREYKALREKGSSLRGHHVPQAKRLKQHDINPDDGTVVVLEHKPHVRTRTWGRRGSKTAKDEADLSLRDSEALDLLDPAVEELGSDVADRIRALNLENFPDLYD